jgi:hypothetical protein
MKTSRGTEKPLSCDGEELHELLVRLDPAGPDASGSCVDLPDPEKLWRRILGRIDSEESTAAYEPSLDESKQRLAPEDDRAHPSAPQSPVR